MIPRFQPALDRNEIVAALRPGQFEVEQFEERFSSKFGCTTGVAFSYGRAALKAFLESVGLRGCEVIVPAYTCSVVAHAITLSGNIPHFVDSELRTYNMDIWELGKAINERTGAVIVTHIFGYAMDVDAVEDIVASAEKRFQKKIWIVQDCAHAFGATWANQAVWPERQQVDYISIRRYANNQRGVCRTGRSAVA
jgi:dTDP-4-amino-4,6-dideoxygalactose transaminase